MEILIKEFASSVYFLCFINFLAPPRTPPEEIRDPCIPSPCGPNSQCTSSGRAPACSCLPGYVGAPPSCRPECVINAECPSQEACINQKCLDPCPGSCAPNAKCTVVRHIPNCVCPPDYVGDPFRYCSPQPSKPPFVSPIRL